MRSSSDRCLTSRQKKKRKEIFSAGEWIIDLPLRLVFSSDQYRQIQFCIHTYSPHTSRSSILFLISFPFLYQLSNDVISLLDNQLIGKLQRKENPIQSPDISTTITYFLDNGIKSGTWWRNDWTVFFPHVSFFRSLEKRKTEKILERFFLLTLSSIAQHSSSSHHDDGDYMSLFERRE